MGPDVLWWGLGYFRQKKRRPVKGGVLRLGREMLMGQIAVARLASI